MSSEANSRRMVYPYTIAAKLAQFPYKFYWNSSGFVRCYVYGIVLCLPFFNYISKLSNSPANYEKYLAIKKKEEEEHKKHLQHLL